MRAAKSQSINMAFLHQLFLLVLIAIFCAHDVVTSHGDNDLDHSDRVRHVVTSHNDDGSDHSNRVRLLVQTGASDYSTDRRFLSNMMGSAMFKREAKFSCDLTSPKLHNMAEALSPSTLRVGGSDSHFLIFDPTNKANESKLRPGDYYMTGEEWDTFIEFLHAAGWDLLFNVNLFTWKDPNAEWLQWDPANTKLLLDYSAQRNISIDYFQIGNEASSYSFKYKIDLSPGNYSGDYQTLRDVLSQYPLYRNSELVGPDVTNLIRSQFVKDYLKEFMEASNGEAVNIVGQHQYYCNGKTANLTEFLDVELMDTLNLMITQLEDIVYSITPNKPLWLSETSSCFGGGAPGLSDSYVAGFLWLDKLGLSAKRGLSRVMRQQFCGTAPYSMINVNIEPHPDFFLSVLYKRLVEGPVFNVTLEPEVPSLRVYAHCARRDVYEYPPGAVVVYYLNTNASDMTVNLTQFGKSDFDLFILTAHDPSALNSEFADLNGHKLSMEGDNLPEMKASKHSREDGSISLSAHSFGFIVIPDARVPLCGWETTTQITVAVEKSDYSTDKRFLSTMLGSAQFRRQEKFTCDLSSHKMQNMAAALSPATLRLGGSDSHFLIFDPTNQASTSDLRPEQFYMTGDEWDTFIEFLHAAGWDLLYNVNLFTWKDPDAEWLQWDPANTKLLLDYSAQRNISIDYFQIGNEASSYSFKYNIHLTPGNYSGDYQSLRDVLSQYPKYRNSELVGPDVTNLIRSENVKDFLREFMEEGGAEVVNIVGQHQYYCDGKTANLTEFLDVDLMDTLDLMITQLEDIVYSITPNKPLWLSETSSCFGGGAMNLSDSYVAGFLFLDKLGVSAKRGISRVMRQQFCGTAPYSMMDAKLNPYPDFFLAVLYKRLVEGPVFNVTLEPIDPSLRVYAHCARRDVYNYPAGAVVVYYLNTKASDMKVHLTQFGMFDLDLFALTTSDPSDLTSQSVNLNGQTLSMEGDNLPEMKASKHSTEDGSLYLSAHSFGFIVIPDAKVDLCGWRKPETRITVGVEKSDYSTDKRFLSNMMGSALFRREKKFSCDLSSPKMKNMAAALAPSTLRLGGSDADFLIFDPTNKASKSELKDGDYYMRGDSWDTFIDFLHAAGWDLLFDVNLFTWKDPNAEWLQWNPENFKELLNYSSERNITIDYFQIGNEASSYMYKYKIDLSPGNYSDDFKQLREVLSEYPLYSDSQLVGPDVTNLIRSRFVRDYLREFLEEGGQDVVDIIGQHQYYCNGRTATVSEFLDVELMDTLNLMITQLEDIVDSVTPNKPFWLSETSSCYGGGAPGLSDSYVAGFLLMDKLGLSAKRGISRVIRQQFCGTAPYSMIDVKLDPFPDFFLGVLFKRLVEGPVFNVTLEPEMPSLRVYSHCARRNVYNYPAGAMVIYYLNTNSSEVTVNLAQYGQSDFDLFILTSYDEKHLDSKYVNLNGHKLSMEGDNLPEMKASKHSSEDGSLSLSAHSFGFIVIPDAKVTLCGWTAPRSTRRPTWTTPSPSHAPAILHGPASYAVTVLCATLCSLLLVSLE